MNGLQLSQSKHRWNRRRNLMRAHIVNTLAVTVSKYSKILYNQDGNVIGSRGSIPDRGAFAHDVKGESSG